MPAVGKIWKTGRGTVPNSQLMAASGTNTPVPGDLVGRSGAGGTLQFVATDPDNTIDTFGVCASAFQDPWKLNRPGYTAGTSGGFNTAGFGGLGSRAATLSPANQVFVFPISHEDRFVMTPTSDTNTPGLKYGINRVGPGDYVVDISDTTNKLLEHMGYYEEDVRNGAAVRRIWVKFVLASA